MNNKARLWVHEEGKTSKFGEICCNRATWQNDETHPPISEKTQVDKTREILMRVWRI
jgi:hypothetical protein